jgi:hypothetical protein
MAERRAALGQRVHFEALVAVGEAKGGGFEAESVDVSLDGMRLRTAYLPDVGDKLVCRFDGMGSEVTAEGEVIWRNQEARGGEFGLRFTGLDPQTEEVIRAMCGSLGGGEAAAPEEPTVPRGARVRLHIDGLGSPMKARVRESAARELEVGSNLEFLKVGRALELEDVDEGKRRDVWIEQVKVAVDPATHVPQLIVSLRYDAGGAGADKSPKQPNGRASAAPSIRRGADPSVGSGREEGRKSIAGAPHAAAAAAARNEAAERAGSGADEPSEGDPEEGLGARAERAGRTVAGRIGPALAGMSSRTKSAMSGIVAAIQKKQADRFEADRMNAPRRTTAPPPGGALKAEGRRLVRDDGTEPEEEEAAPPPRMNRRAAAMGGALGLTAVLVLYGITRLVGARSAESATAASPDATAVASASASLAAVGALSGSTPAALPPSSAPGTPVTDVPLFGATPLSTTEPVPPPAQPSASAVALAGMPPAPEDDGAAASGDVDNEESPADREGHSLKEWGKGNVRHPVVLKLKMDGRIERLNGAAGAMGFTISLPDRRSLSMAQDLARKDKRLASVNVINTSHGAEVTVQFKDGVPSYLARAKGDRLSIMLGTDGHKKVAKKKKGDEKAKPRSSKKKPHS